MPGPAPKVVTPGSAPRVYGDIDTDEDFESYGKAYMKVGVLVTGRTAKTYVKAKVQVEQQMGWTRRSEPTGSRRRPGLPSRCWSRTGTAC